MKFLNNLQKSIKAHHLLFLGIVVAAIALFIYSHHKSTTTDSMTSGHSNNKHHEVQAHAHGEDHPHHNGVQPSAPLGENEEYARVHGLESRNSGVSNCHKQEVQDPSSLLPKDENSEWARLNPTGNGTLDKVNLLKAGHHIGIDTVGQSLRNANLQVRSEPANPQLNVGPWNNTTIQPDLMRVPLELGCGPQ